MHKISNNQISQLLYWNKSMPHFKRVLTVSASMHGVDPADYVTEATNLVTSGACTDERKVRHISAQISDTYLRVNYKDDNARKLVAYEYTLSRLGVNANDYRAYWNEVYTLFCDENYIVTKERLVQDLFDTTKVFLDKGGIGTIENYESLTIFILRTMVDYNKDVTQMPPHLARNKFLTLIRNRIQNIYAWELETDKKNMYKVPPELLK